MEDESWVLADSAAAPWCPEDEAADSALEAPEIVRATADDGVCEEKSSAAKVQSIFDQLSAQEDSGAVLLRPKPSKSERQEDADNHPQGTATETQLNAELRMLARFVDRCFAVVMISACIGVLWLALPEALGRSFMLLMSGLALSAGGAVYSEVLGGDAVVLLLLNVLVIAPFNVLLFLAFYITYPLRLPVYALIQCFLIPCMTSFKEFKWPWKATFKAFLEIVPQGYDFILPKDPKLKPFDNIDDATQEEAAAAMRASGVSKSLAAYSSQHFSRTMLNSLAFRLVVFMILCPTIGWWLVGQCFIPLLPVRAACATPFSEETELDTKPADDMPAVQFAIPKCRWLRVAREEWGEEVGRKKCLNE